jgi:hypothetical protein
MGPRHGLRAGNADAPDRLISWHMLLSSQHEPSQRPVVQQDTDTERFRCGAEDACPDFVAKVPCTLERV